MDSTRWDRIQTLFHDAVDLPEAEQHSFVKAACGGDPALLADVLAMLGEDARGASLLDRDVAHVANQMLGEAVPPSFKEFGPYRIKRILGEGGMGVVYLAERDDLRNLVAIKILRDAWLSPARRERFASEQRTLAQLNHPSIARIYDADSLADGTPWFAMEYVEGAPLTEYSKQRACSIEERLQLFRAVCEAVQHAHLHAVIHRDLKPSNILVRPDGSVRLLDFGIAKQLDRFDAPVDQTRTALRLMTPAYAAPEQIRGQRVGIYTDVYSLGVVLYELLAGKLPFDLSNRSAGEAETLIVEQAPEKPSAVAAQANGAAWADLDVLCLTAMHKDPERRYRSVEALIRDIDHYLKGEPLDARPDTLRYRAGKFVGRNRRAVTAAALVFAIGFGLVVFFTARLAIARNAALAEAARTQRIQRFMLNLFHGGDEAAGPADSLRVVALLDRGVQEAQTLNREPAVQAELYQTLGGLYQKLGKLDQADSLMRSALDQHRSLFGPDRPEVADSLIALGLLRADQARWEEAERFVREGLAIRKRTRPANDAAVAKAMTAVGKVLEQKGAYPDAIKLLDEAVRLQSSMSVPPSDLAESLSELANTHFNAGHYPIADSLYHRVLETHRRIYGEHHPVVADDLTDLGAVQQDLGYYSEAERYHRQALDITESYYGKDHAQTALALNTLGRALIYEKKYDEAAGLLHRALTIRERVFGPVHPLVASTLNEIANVAYMQDKLDEAEAGFSRVVDIYRQVYHNHHSTIGVALANLASVYLDRKQYPRAEQLYEQALQMYADTLPEDNVNTAITQMKLGATLVRDRRYAEAEGHILKGYAILIKQTNPSTSYLRSARKNLATVYDALHQPEKAEKFRAELAATDSQAAARK